MADSPFSGGGGKPVDPNAPKPTTPQVIVDLQNLLNERGTRKYVIDANGSKIELKFKTDGFVTFKSGDTSMELPYTLG
jgi:hypothetical protein